MPTDGILDSLDSIGKEVKADILPESEVMVKKSLEILAKSSISYPLVEMVKSENIKIYIVKTKREINYRPEQKTIYIGIKPSAPSSPAKTILLIADMLLEIKMLRDGMDKPSSKLPKEKYISKMADLKAKKLAELCSIAFDLEQKAEFKKFNFTDEMRMMGHSDTVDIFIDNF